MPDIELKELHEEMKKAWADFQAKMKKQDEEIARLGAPTQETKNHIDALNAKISELETKLNRAPFLQEKKQDNAPSEAKKAFLEFARKGELGPEQRKALTVSDDTTGGYLAPSEYVAEIIKTITEFSPIRSVARIRSTSAKSVRQPKRTGQFAAAWTSEQGTRSETTGLKYGMEEIPTHEMYAKVIISQQDLEDSAFSLESELNMEASEQFGVAEGLAFVSGNGVAKPEGLLSNSSVGEVVTGSNSAVTADSLIDLFYALKDAYAKNASWLLKRATIGSIRKLKDSQNQYLWQPGLMADQPSTILGRPYQECVDMPAIATNAYPVIFGDFRRGYLIIDRVQISLQRDPFTDADNGNVVFRIRKRVGGQVVLAEAMKKLKVST